MNEIYKDIENFNGKYQISNLGNVKSLYFNKEYIMKLSKDKDGYPDIALSFKGKYKTLHQLTYMILLIIAHGKD